MVIPATDDQYEDGIDTDGSDEEMDATELFLTTHGASTSDYSATAAGFENAEQASDYLDDATDLVVEDATSGGSSTTSDGSTSSGDGDPEEPGTTPDGPNMTVGGYQLGTLELLAIGLAATGGVYAATRGA